jgi:dipeptidyl aminopeptidase/acylaminoacyl peptidase
VVKRRLLLIAALALLALVATVALAGRAGAPRSAVASPQAPATPSAAGPLAITAIRGHQLTPGTVTTVSELAARDGCRVFDVSFTSDGYKQYALLTEPTAATPAGGYPVVIIAHGYINPQQYQTTGADYQGFTDAYCAAGYAVLKPDYRGHGRSEGAATGGHFSPGYTYDLLNLTASLKSRPELAATKVVWLGHSMGSHVVLRALVADHHLPVKGAVLVSGVVGSLEDLAYHWDRTNIPADIPPIRQRIIDQVGSPQQNPGFWHDASAINYVSAINVPVDIHHGDADTVVPLAFSQHLDAALADAHKPHNLYVYPGGDHQFTQTAARQLFLERSLAFLRDHLQ